MLRHRQISILLSLTQADFEYKALHKEDCAKVILHRFKVFQRSGSVRLERPQSIESYYSINFFSALDLILNDYFRVKHLIDHYLVISQSIYSKLRPLDTTYNRITVGQPKVNIIIAAAAEERRGNDYVRVRKVLIF